MNSTVQGAGGDCLSSEILLAMEKEAQEIYEVIRAGWIRLAQAHGEVKLAPSQLPSHHHRSLKGF